LAAIENADRKFRGASQIDVAEAKELLANAAESGGGHAGPPGGHRGPPGGGRGGPPGGGRRGPPGGEHGGPGGRRGPPGGPGGFNPVEMFETQDANGDEKLTGDEIPDRMRDHLDRVDTDGNGEVSKEEIEALAERFQRGGPGGGRGGPPGGGRGGPRGEDGGGPDGGNQSDRPQRPE